MKTLTPKQPARCVTTQRRPTTWSSVKTAYEYRGCFRIQTSLLPACQRPLETRNKVRRLQLQVKQKSSLNSKCSSSNALSKTRGGGIPYMKGVGMLVVWPRGVNFGFWSSLGCSWRNTIIFSRKRLF